MTWASNNDDIGRDPNNLQRKRCYRRCAVRLPSQLDLACVSDATVLLLAQHDLGYRWRRRLPACVVGAVRAAYPSPTGHYMGYMHY